MKELRETQHVAGDSQALLAWLRRDGYLLLRDLVPVRDVAHAVSALIEVLSKHGWVCDSSGRIAQRARRRLNSDEMDSVYCGLQGCEAVHRLVCHSAIRTVVESLLGPAVVHPQRIIRTTLPVGAGGPSSPAVHRDYPSWRVTDMITVWLPLLQCPPERGGLCVLEASHLDGLDYPVDLVGPRWVTTTYQPGDALFLHCFTVHGALPNDTDRLRLSVDSRWQSLGEPVPDWACRPDAGRDWAQYTAGWSSTTWVELPPNAEVIDDENQPWAELIELPPSPLLTEARRAR